MEIKPAILFFHFLPPTATFSPLIGTILYFAHFSRKKKKKTSCPLVFPDLSFLCSLLSWRWTLMCKVRSWAENAIYGDDNTAAVTAELRRMTPPPLHDKPGSCILTVNVNVNVNWNDPQLNIVSTSNGISRSLLPLASCLDCFYFLSLHSFSFSLNGNTWSDTERKTDRQSKSKIRHPWLYAQGALILWGLGGFPRFLLTHSQTLHGFIHHRLWCCSCIVMNIIKVLASEKKDFWQTGKPHFTNK